MKYGIKTILRFPVRSILFFVLIAAAALFLSLGVSIWVSAQNMLSAADETCITAGEVVFQGGYYPDSAEYDPALAAISRDFNMASLSGLPGVLLAEENNEHRAYIKNHTLKNNNTPYNGFAVFELEVIARVENKDFYLAHILDTIYSAEENLSGSLYIFPQAGMDISPGRKYLMSGNLKMIYNNLIVGLHPSSYASVSAAAGGPDADYPVIIDVTDYSEADMASFWENQTGQTYKKLMEMVDVINHSYSLVASANIEAVEAFHRREYTLIEGRFFNEQDIIAGNTCIISSHMAEKLGLHVGGTLDMDVHHTVDGAGIYASYWPEMGFAFSGGYQIVGIYQTADMNTPIYIPDAGQTWLGRSGNDYVLGRVMIQNGLDAPFMSEAEKLLPSGVTLRLYDQGYAQTEQALSGMLETAVVITLVSAAACLVILIFFGYIFVSRHSTSMSILMSLGTGFGRIWLFLVSGAGLVAVLSAVTGGTIAYLLSDYLTKFIFADAQTPDRRFSVSRSGFQAYIPEPSVELWPFFMSAALVVGVALLLCSVLVLLMLHAQDARYQLKQKSKQIKRGQKSDGKRHLPSKAFGVGFASKLPGLTLRYGVKATLRGGRRALVMTFVFAVLFCSVGVIGGMKAKYELSLKEAYTDIPVTLHFTDSKGRMIDNLSISQSAVRTLEDVDFIADVWYSRSDPYHFAGTEKAEPDWAYIPEIGSFAYEAFRSQLDTRFPTLVMSDNPAYTKEYFYSDKPEIQWTQGYDLSRYQKTFSQKKIDTKSYSYHSPEGSPSVLVTGSFLDTHGLSLGDTIYLQMFTRNENGVICDYRMASPIAGVLSGGTSPDTIYMTSGMIDTSRRYNAAGALLKNTERLSEIRDNLSGKFSETYNLTGNRIWIYIDDTELYQTVDNLMRHIDYLNALYPILLVVSVGIGFLIANLTLRSRRMEIALLRSVGTSKAAVFFSLLWEQLLLCVPGLLLGVIGILFVLGGMVIDQSWQLALYTAFFLTGAAAAIVQTQRTSLMKNLLEGE